MIFLKNFLKRGPHRPWFSTTAGTNKEFAFIANSLYLTIFSFSLCRAAASGRILSALTLKFVDILQSVMVTSTSMGFPPALETVRSGRLLISSFAVRRLLLDSFLTDTESLIEVEPLHYFPQFNHSSPKYNEMLLVLVIISSMFTVWDISYSKV